MPCEGNITSTEFDGYTLTLYTFEESESGRSIALEKKGGWISLVVRAQRNNSALHAHGWRHCQCTATNQAARNGCKSRPPRARAVGGSHGDNREALDLNQIGAPKLFPTPPP
jgi:hypothetical protein